MSYIFWGADLFCLKLSLLVFASFFAPRWVSGLLLRFDIRLPTAAGPFCCCNRFLVWRSRWWFLSAHLWPMSGRKRVFRAVQDSRERASERRRFLLHRASLRAITWRLWNMSKDSLEERMLAACPLCFLCLSLVFFPSERLSVCPFCPPLHLLFLLILSLLSPLSRPPSFLSPSSDIVGLVVFHSGDGCSRPSDPCEQNTSAGSGSAQTWTRGRNDQYFCFSGRGQRDPKSSFLLDSAQFSSVL